MGRVDGRTSEKLRERFKDSWKRGGGGIWTTPAIDPKRNIVYFTTGNPWPDFDGSSRPGDNLFTDCVVALDATTGEIKWYFQESAHDVSDLDAASPPVLLTTIDDAGRSVEAVAEVGKTGAFYLLDRGTGALIRKTRNVAVFESHGGAKGWEGGSEWSAMSYDPSAQYAIVTTEQHLKPETGTSAPSERRSVTKEWSSGYGSVSAIMPASGQIAWQDKFDEGMVGGTVSTAGGLTFTGEANGYFDALETKTGARLWHFQTGAGVNAAPIVFQAGQHEYVAVASGGNRQLGTNYGDAVFVFRLDGH